VPKKSKRINQVLENVKLAEKPGERRKIYSFLPRKS